MNIGIVLAGGSGVRVGSDIPKQFIDIGGKPLIVYTLEAFNKNSNIDYIAVICKKDYEGTLEQWIKEYNLNKIKWIVEGGSTRQQSVENGLKKLQDVCTKEDIVLIHDGARPLITDNIINENIDRAKVYGAINTVIPCTDTIISSTKGDGIEAVPNRSELYQCQTPQSFQYGVICKAHEFAKNNALSSATDDCQLVFAMGKKVYFANGDRLNFKVTTKEDLIILKALINQ